MSTIEKTEPTLEKAQQRALSRISTTFEKFSRISTKKLEAHAARTNQDTAHYSIDLNNPLVSMFLTSSFRPKFTEQNLATLSAERTKLKETMRGKGVDLKGVEISNWNCEGEAGGSQLIFEYAMTP